MSSSPAAPHRSITLNGRTLNAIGQGTWQMGDDLDKRASEIAALQRGLDLGLSLIDTAEMYGDGRSESLVGQSIAHRRSEVFLTSKVLPSNASRRGTVEACHRSLKNLATDYLDLYLLHWPGSHPLAETVAAFDDLRAAGKILGWGVSNFDVPDLDRLYALHPHTPCAANQILYNPEHRGPEFDLLPWAAAHHLPITAYSPVGQGRNLLSSRTLLSIARRHNATSAQVALAWELRQPNLCVIPKAATVQHVEENAAAANLQLTPEDLTDLDQAYPPPTHKTHLATL